MEMTDLNFRMFKEWKDYVNGHLEKNELSYVSENDRQRNYYLHYRSSFFSMYYFDYILINNLASEMDFINDGIRLCNNYIESFEGKEFTNEIKELIKPFIFDRYMTSHLIPCLKMNIEIFEKRKEIIQKNETNETSKDEVERFETLTIDNRISKKAPTNQEKIYALKLFCPELWEKLQKIQDKEIQQNIIHLITGVNLEDSYKLSFGSRQKFTKIDKIALIEEWNNKLK